MTFYWNPQTHSLTAATFPEVPEGAIRLTEVQYKVMQLVLEHNLYEVYKAIEMVISL